MKKLFKLLVVALSLGAVMVSCGGDETKDDKDVTITADKATVAADGTDTVTFTVKYGDEDVTSSAKILCDGTQITGNTFTSTAPGSYKFTAEYDGKTSKNEVSVAVEEAPAGAVVLSVDKTKIVADAVDTATFTVTQDGNDITSSAKITYRGQELGGNTFAVSVAGEYNFTAEYDGRSSNQITVNAVARIVLTIDKESIMADGADIATFTVMQGDNDVTADSKIMLDGEELEGNTFTTRTVGEYGFTAKYDILTSEEAVLTATEPIPLVLSVDKFSIEANNQEIVTFTVMQGDVDVTDECSICDPSGSCLVGNTFKTSQAGEYEFYASFVDGRGDKSNYVTVNAINLVDFDSAKEPHKNVTYFTFTASWCGPCWYFKGYLKNIMADYEDNIVQVNFYSNDSVAEVRNSLTTTFINQISQEGRFSVSGYPTSITELRENIGTPGYVPTEAQARTAYNTYVAYPGKTAIRVRSVIDDDKVTATVTVGAKEADTYKIGVLLVEDNIVAYQANGGNNYNHTDVLRDRGMTNLFGEDFGTLAAGGTMSKEYTFDVKSNYNPDNLHLVVYTLYEESGSMVISNCVKVTAKGITDFKYQ